jgi:hypothetical protein
MTKTDVIGDAWGYSRAYLLRYYLAGFLAIPSFMAMSKGNPAATAAFVVFHNVLAVILSCP